MKHKDLKTGLVLGLILVIIVVIRLATDPRLSPTARMLKLHSVTAQEDFQASPNDFSQAEPTQNEFPESDSTIIDLEPAGLTPDKQINTSTKTEQITADVNPTEPINSTQYEQTEKIKTQKFHIVRKDQTLSAISKEHYGSAGKWKKIFDANRDVIKDANKLQPGMKLIIPD
jgi:nucleoid-associated protein YgaU